MLLYYYIFIHPTYCLYNSDHAVPDAAKYKLICFSHRSRRTWCTRTTLTFLPSQMHFLSHISRCKWVKLNIYIINVYNNKIPISITFQVAVRNVVMNCFTRLKVYGGPQLIQSSFVLCDNYNNIIPNFKQLFNTFAIPYN